MKLSAQQDAALKAVATWLADPAGRQWFYLAGYAGTGKTTIARRFADDLDGKVCYAAFTGKAALVMKSRGCRGASTIHSLIYKLEDENEGTPRFVLNSESAAASAALVVIDEVSMVDERLAADLLSFGTRVLVIGDPAQLPPVKGTGFFTAGEPDFMLTEVHRQAAENPIIRMSMEVREGGRLAVGTYGESRVITRAELGQKMVRGADQVLVGKNQTRHQTNAKIRALLGFSAEVPEVGERLVCLRNNSTKGLLNGGLWSVADIDEADKEWVRLFLDPEDVGMRRQRVEVQVHPFFFHGREADIPRDVLRLSDEFAYGYALTVHKSQGSQWNDVVLFDESATFREDARRWLYTGVTRAAEKIVVVR